MEALQATSYFIEKGFWCFSPIVQSHNLPCNVGERVSFEFWKDFDVETITRMDELWVLCIPGWKESKGVTGEIEVALLQGKVILFLNTPDDKLAYREDGQEGKWIVGAGVHPRAEQRARNVEQILNSVGD
jgi:hypothetical protein